MWERRLWRSLRLRSCLWGPTGQDFGCCSSSSEDEEAGAVCWPTVMLLQARNQSTFQSVVSVHGDANADDASQTTQRRHSLLFLGLLWAQVQCRFLALSTVAYLWFWFLTRSNKIHQEPFAVNRLLSYCLSRTATIAGCCVYLWMCYSLPGDITSNSILNKPYNIMILPVIASG